MSDTSASSLEKLSPGYEDHSNGLDIIATVGSQASPMNVAFALRNEYVGTQTQEWIAEMLLSQQDQLVTHSPNEEVVNPYVGLKTRGLEAEDKTQNYGQGKYNRDIPIVIPSSHLWFPDNATSEDMEWLVDMRKRYPTWVLRLPEEQVVAQDNEDSRYKIVTKCPVVIQRNEQWFQVEPSEDEKKANQKKRTTCPVWAKHISVSNWQIGGELGTFMVNVQNKMYPPEMGLKDKVGLTKWFQEHTTVCPKRYPGQEYNASAGSFIPASRLDRWYIKIRKPRSKHGNYPWQDYMYISKSQIGCTNIGYNATIKPPNDHTYTVVDPDLYARAGYGLFFNRDFKKHECIGVYCGDLVHKRYLADTGYNIDWMKNKHYVVDAKGPGHPIYFGWHYANAPENKEGANVFVDDHMLVFTNKDVKKGDEAYFFYGEKRDVIDNLLPQKKREKASQVSERRERRQMWVRKL